jgi:LmbE family N-acetylglucosaminyl deacetylase
MKRLLLALTLAATVHAYDPLSQDRGASGAWQKIQKLRTIASLLHTTAHPDDEHGAMLAMMSRGEGARVALLTLNRGEAGDNAIGPELFDALGLIRTEELLRADQYYGVDQQYFTSVVDYGFSKRLEEAFVKWGRENVLRDVVRTIRRERPLVLVSRFQGNERDGHGNHQAAGLITQEAYKAAGDPTAFPEQIRDEGLTPWQPLKLYMGGVRENEDWTLRVDTNTYNPWLGDTYANFARLGLAYQRSQNSGRVDTFPGARYLFYKRLASRVDAPAKEQSFFDGIDITPTWYAPIAQHVDEAMHAFSMQDPSLAAPALARGLKAARDAELTAGLDVERLHLLTIKEQQFVDAICAALGVDFSAVAQADRPIVAGESFDVQVRSAVHTTVPVQGIGATGTHPMTIAASMPPTRPYFSRDTISASRYVIADAEAIGRPWAAPRFVTTMEFSIGDVPVRITTPIVYRQSQAPYGIATRELAVVPALAVNVSPRQAIVPLASSRPVAIDVELLNNAAAGSRGELTLKLPAGWTSTPRSFPFSLARAGERARHAFSVSPSSVSARDYSIGVVATLGEKTFTEGYDVIEHRDLETRYLYQPSTVHVRGVDVKVAPSLKVGYVMGVGDEVPDGIAQLEADVHLLTAQDLANGDLGRFNTIVTGTRAYGVREDLRTYNARLLDYVKNGGNLIVLYNTPQEFDPQQLAPFPATLPRDAEEVSEEDSPVTVLAPQRPEFTTPNAITRTDFDGWIEQRGSKFFSAWDSAYTPMIETHDQGQAPQRGGWLTASYGKGHYTYFAYALHRQLPFGVPGAYRILANLLSLRSR